MTLAITSKVPNLQRNGSCTRLWNTDLDYTIQSLSEVSIIYYIITSEISMDCSNKKHQNKGVKETSPHLLYLHEVDVGMSPCIHYYPCFGAFITVIPTL